MIKAIKPMPRPTVQDVARLSGVSVATVDRVINARSNVREETAHRVMEAAEAIGFHGSRLIRNRVETAGQPHRLGFLLQRQSMPFYQRLGEALTALPTQAAFQGLKVVVKHLDDLTPVAVARELERLGHSVEAIGAVASDHPVVNQAIDRLQERGVPTFALLTNLSSPRRAGFIGLNNRKVGRTAAWAVATLCRTPGKIGCFVGSHRYLGQEAREMSFRSYFRELGSDFTVLEPLASLEDHHLAYEGTLSVLKRHPDLVGLYVAGGGIEGVIAALRETARPNPIVTVCHDLTDIIRDAVVDGTVQFVISHPLQRLATAAAETMLARLETPGESVAEVVMPFEIDVVETM